MFERYTERARRVLFFARYEASQLGSLTIETEHLLLGLIREGKGLTSRIFARAHLSVDNIRKEIEDRTVFREMVSTSVEIPFSADVKRALGFAAEEADRLLHNYIGTEHLLLGVLREERSVAASILMEKGMRLHTVREDIVQLLNEKTTLTGAPEADFVTHIDHETEAVRVGDARGAPRTVPNFVPSRLVHIAYSDYSPEQAAWIQRAGPSWRAHGFTLSQIIAHAWGSDEARVRIEDSRSQDAEARYDFMIVLRHDDGSEVIPRLLREAIETQLDIEVTREDGDPPTLIVRPSFK